MWRLTEGLPWGSTEAAWTFSQARRPRSSARTCWPARNVRNWEPGGALAANVEITSASVQRGDVIQMSRRTAWLVSTSLATWHRPTCPASRFGTRGWRRGWQSSAGQALAVLAITRVATDTTGRVVEAALLVLPGDRAEAVFTNHTMAEERGTEG